MESTITDTTGIIIFDQELQSLSKRNPKHFLIEVGKGDRGGYSTKAHVFQLSSAITQFQSIVSNPENALMRKRLVAVCGRRDFKITLALAKPSASVDDPNKVPEYVRTAGLFGPDSNLES